jgi:hypothetical protein
MEQAARRQISYLSRQRQLARFSKFQANKGSASDCETANAEALYAPQKGVESPIEVKSQN